MDKKQKKIIMIVLISLGAVLLVGIGLCCAAQCIPYTPLMIPGLIVAGVGAVPIVVISIIFYFKFL